MNYYKVLRLVKLCSIGLIMIYAEPALAHGQYGIFKGGIHISYFPYNPKRYKNHYAQAHGRKRTRLSRYPKCGKQQHHYKRKFSSLHSRQYPTNRYRQR